MTTKTRWSRVDHEAMLRAIEMARAESEPRREQIDGMLVHETFEEVGEFAASCCQDRALRLKPWQVSPCSLDTDAAVRAALAAPPTDHRGFRMAAGLVLELRAAGLSRLNLTRSGRSPKPVRRRSAMSAYRGR